MAQDDIERMDQDQNLPPTPLSRKQQLEQWQAQKRVSMEPGKKFKGTSSKEPSTPRHNGTPIARSVQAATTPRATRPKPAGAPLGNNPALVNSDTGVNAEVGVNIGTAGVQNTPQADRTAKYLQNASARPSMLSPVKMGVAQRTPSKLGQPPTPKATRVALPTPKAETSKAARVALPCTPLPSKGFKTPMPVSFDQRKGREWTPSKGGRNASGSEPLEAIFGRVAALKGSLTPQGKGSRQAGGQGGFASKCTGGLTAEIYWKVPESVKHVSLVCTSGSAGVADKEQSTDASYWLGQIREAEVRGDHGTVITLFEKAVSANAQPAKDLVRALQQYRGKYMPGPTAQQPSKASATASKREASEQPDSSQPRAPESLQGRGVEAAEEEPLQGENTLPSDLAAGEALLQAGVTDTVKSSPVVGKPNGPGPNDAELGRSLEGYNPLGTDSLATVLVTPVSPGGRRSQSSSGGMDASPWAQEEGLEMQVYVTPVRQSPPKNAETDYNSSPASVTSVTGDLPTTPTTPKSVPFELASVSGTPGSPSSSEADKTEELPQAPPFVSPSGSPPTNETSPTRLLPENRVDAEPSQAHTPKISSRRPLQNPTSQTTEAATTPAPTNLLTPQASRLQTPNPSGPVNLQLQTPAGSPSTFDRTPNSPAVLVTPERTLSFALNPSLGSPGTPQTPRLLTNADVALTPATKPLTWQPGSDGPEAPGSGPGQSTPAAIQMPSVQRSASRVTVDVIRTPGLSRKLNLDGSDPNRTPNRTPLSRFALKSPIGGARRVPLFGGLTPVKGLPAESAAEATGGVNKMAGAEFLTPPAAEQPAGAASGVKLVAATGSKAADSTEGSPLVANLTPRPAQIADFPVALKGRKSLKPSPLNLSGPAKPAVPVESRSSPLKGFGSKGLTGTVADAGLEGNGEKTISAALDGFVQMVAHVARNTLAQQEAERQTGSGVVSARTAPRGSSGADKTTTESVHTSDQRTGKAGAGDVERWLRRARGVASPVTPGATLGQIVTNGSGSEIHRKDAETEGGHVNFPPVDSEPTAGGHVDRAGTNTPVEKRSPGVNTLHSRSSPRVKTPDGSTSPSKDAFGDIGKPVELGVTGKEALGEVKETPNHAVTALEVSEKLAQFAGGVNAPTSGVNTPISGDKGTPMLRQERARLPQILIDNSQRTPGSAKTRARGQGFNALLETPSPMRTPQPAKEALTPGAATADEWAAAADEIHRNQVSSPVNANPCAFGSPVSPDDRPIDHTGSTPDTLPELPTLPKTSTTLPESLRRIAPATSQSVPRVVTPTRQLSSRFTPSRLSRPRTASATPPAKEKTPVPGSGLPANQVPGSASPASPPDQRKTPVSAFAANRGSGSVRKILGSPAQRMSGFNAGRSTGKLGARELRQLNGTPKLLGHGASVWPAATTILSPVRANKLDRAALRAQEFVLSPVRRSGRNPVADGGVRQSREQVEGLLEMTGYTYTPNKALSESDGIHKTPAARRMAQLTSRDSPPELAALVCQEDATCHDQSGGQLHPVGTEREGGIREQGRQGGENESSPKSNSAIVEVMDSELPSADKVAIDTLTQAPEAAGVQTLGELGELPAQQEEAAVHTRRATRRSGPERGLATGLQANPRRRGVRGAAATAEAAAKNTAVPGVNPPEENPQNKITRGGRNHRGRARDGLADKGVNGDVTSDGTGLTTESSGDSGQPKRAVTRKTVSFAVSAQNPVKETFTESFSVQTAGAGDFRSRGRAGRLGNRRQSLGKGLQTATAVGSNQSGPIPSSNVANDGAKSDVAEQTGLDAARPKRVSFAPSPNQAVSDKPEEPLRTARPARAGARRQSVGAALLPHTARTGDVTETPLAAPEYVRTSIQTACDDVTDKTRPEGRPARASARRQIAAHENGHVADDVTDQHAEVIKSTTTGARRAGRRKGLGPVEADVTSAVLTRGSQRSEGSESEGAPKRGRGRRGVIGGSPPKSSNQQEHEAQDGNKADGRPGEASSGAQISANESDVAEQVVGGRRTGRRSARRAPPVVPESQLGPGPVVNAVPGRTRRGVLEDSTNVVNLPPQEVGRPVGVKGRRSGKKLVGGLEGSSPDELVIGTEGVKVLDGKKEDDSANGLGDLTVGTRIQVWWPDDKRFYGGVVTEIKPRSGKHKVLYDDGDSEELLLSMETWRIEKSGRRAKLTARA